MTYKDYYKLMPSYQIKMHDNKYVINEFKTIKHDGHIYLAQAFRFVSDNDTKWCRCGVYHANMIKNEMQQHMQDYYILNGTRYEVEQ